MARTVLVLISLLAAAAGCRSRDVAADPVPESAATPDATAEDASVPDPASDPWSADFDPPGLLVTDRVRLEPLAPRHVELDFEALMGSREHLQRTLHWGDWPRADFTVEENRADLERHWGEFERREAYAYTVLAPDGSRCVGCIYLNPMRRDDLPDGAQAGMLAYWVIEEELANDLDRHLLASLLTWFEDGWPLDLVFFLPHVDDGRGATLLADAGLAELDGSRPTHRTFVWEAD